MKYSFYNQVFSDGQAMESPEYNLIWVDRLASLSELLRKGGLDLYNTLKLKMLFDSPLKITSIGNYSVDWGDSVSVLGKVLGWNSNTATASIASPFSKVANSSNVSILRIGVIGTGARGTGLIKVLSEIPAVKIVALCDLQKKNLDNALQYTE